MQKRKIKKLLIANRGEIACRIIKTARKLGIKTVAVHSDVDRNSLHVRSADDAIYIGPAAASRSYLNHKAIIHAAQISGADAVHPGYGFLSENPEFASLVRRNGIIFVGPSSDSIKKMGDKIEAKKVAHAANVSIVPGYIGVLESEQNALEIAKSIGYPIMLKAVAGGGGKGMRVVRSSEEMLQAYNSTSTEAKNSFFDSRTFIEKLIINPKHIEIQILGDIHGNYVCIGERDCSTQRRHQKVIEEAPSTFLNEDMRRRMYEQSISLARQNNYFSAGTIEFIVDADGNFYFMEMNTRLQVEHPVTELITGIDLVEQMIRIAEGRALEITQDDIKFNGHAIEARIYAEDPECAFIPSTGRISTYQEPSGVDDGVRIDSGIYEGGEVSMFYDAMISKVCTHSQTREGAIKLMASALERYIIRGISTNISFLQAIMSSDAFLNNTIYTNFIDEEYKDGFSSNALSTEENGVMLCAAIYIFLTDMRRRQTINGQFRGISRSIGTRWVVSLDDVNYPVTVRTLKDSFKISFEDRRFYISSNWILGSKLFACSINGVNYSLQVEYQTSSIDLFFKGVKTKAHFFSPRAGELKKFMPKVDSAYESTGDIFANISGIVSDMKVLVGDTITKNQPILILEAMKMENIIRSKIDGKVKEIKVSKGDVCVTGDLLVSIEPSIS
ncbi:MAG: acetyl/propionyl/methylcrotonyl-CoA carboxylase subunit alpha [Proteobacteria bacterium]|nr:acetyl/propionyl/methylcrotonyl-CoA carboxylase subunit alpha [Pseudomonadota bacterium]